MAIYTDYPVYPTAILSLTDYPTQYDDVDWIEAALVNALVKEVIAIQAELGTLPKGTLVSLKDRLSVSFADNGTLLPTSLWAETPTYSTSAGDPGEISYDTQFFYLCYDTDSWSRAELTSW